MNKDSLNKKCWTPSKCKKSGIAPSSHILKVIHRIGVEFYREASSSEAISFSDEMLERMNGKTFIFSNTKPALPYSYKTVDTSDIPSDVQEVDINYVGLSLGFFRLAIDGKIHLNDDCVKLNEGSRFITEESKYIPRTQTRYSSYLDGYIHKDEACYVVSSGEYFMENYQPDTVFFSDYNDAYVDENDPCVYWGIYRYGVDMGYFYSSSPCRDVHERIWYADSDVAEEHDVYYDECLGEYTSCPSPNASYQSLTRKFKFTGRTTFGIGFEIEKEDEDAYEIPYLELYKDKGWCKENDGSLDEYGYELVSPAFDLFTSDLDNDIKSSVDLRCLINGDHTTNCGGHLTLSSCEYTANELLEGVAGFVPLLYAMYNGRIGNDYCSPKQKWVYHRGGNRDAINLRGNRMVVEAENKIFGAIEFRIFSAVRNVNNLIWRRDLMRIFANNINKSERDVLKMLCSPNSLLFKHLNKVYSVDRIVDKIKLFVEFSKEYNFRKLEMPDLDAVRAKLKENRTEINGNASDELGA